MRLFERMLQAQPAKRGFRHQGQSQAEQHQISINDYLEQSLNHRLQPGAGEYTQAYQQWYPALNRLADDQGWPDLSAYLLHMEPRIGTLTIRPFRLSEGSQAVQAFVRSREQTRQPELVFVLQFELLADPATLHERAVLKLSNGKIHLALMG
ncbi:hypothetical protein [Reinekea sp.]|jgi:hypothetical protein|uniref:hypothetical protein n=1 Tax=Reinekea sp. TaxID=1970455 RepID=UPI002A8020EF|nr:hypothetical protein [Reinekea sp.]